MLKRLLRYKSKSSPQASKFFLEAANDSDEKARLYYQQGYYREAAIHYRRSLELREQLGENHPDVLDNNYHLAIALKEFGDFTEATKLIIHRLEILQNHLGSTHPDFQKARLDLGDIPFVENYDQMERLFHSCLSKIEKKVGSDHPYVAECLAKLGEHLLKVGKYAEAEPIFFRSLALVEKQPRPKHQDVARLLTKIAKLYCMLGNYAEALSFYERGLSLLQDQVGPDHPDFAKALGSRAALSESLGNYSESEHFYRRCITILEERLSPEHPEIAKNLENLAALLNKNGKPTEATVYFDRCYDILNKQYAPEHPAIMMFLTKQAHSLFQLGDYTGAEKLCRRSLSIRKRRLGPDSLDVAGSLSQLSITLNKLTKYDEADSLCRRSLAIFQQHLGLHHPEVAQCLMILASHLDETEHFSSAAFCAKKAINIFQDIRHNVSGMGEEPLHTFDISIEIHYNFLANILIKASRYGEAEYVMGMLKDKELLELFRRDLNVDITIKTIPFNSIEESLEKQLDLISSDIYEMGREIGDLMQIKDRLPAQDQSLAELQKALYKRTRNLTEFFDGLSEAFPATYSNNNINTLLNSDVFFSRFVNTTTIFTVTSANDFHTLMMTPHGHMPFSSKQKALGISKKILMLRDLLKDIESDAYLPLAQELYDIIIRPMEQELDSMGNETIIWMLNGSLRLLPLPALHDGKQFLVEKFSNVCITTISNVGPVSHEPWNGLGMGTTREYEGHQPLHAVKDELEGIIRIDGSAGILQGKILLDDEFTIDSMQTNLADGYKAVHFASHFMLNPANEIMSYLLLGDGSKIRMDELRELPKLFNGVDLVAFSACSTGLGTTSIKGREVDGIGYLGELQGAKAVLATLWPVDDKSTSMLMREFYKLRENSDTKAEALRKAQLALLMGEIESEDGYDFTHPYFWAPFILIGNGG